MSGAAFAVQLVDYTTQYPLRQLFGSERAKHIRDAREDCVGGAKDQKVKFLCHNDERVPAQVSITVGKIHWGRYIIEPNSPGLIQRPLEYDDTLVIRQPEDGPDGPGDPTFN